MYSSSDDSDRYSSSDGERTGDDGSIPVSNSANKEESTLLNYEHEYDDYAKDVIGKNLVFRRKNFQNWLFAVVMKFCKN